MTEAEWLASTDPGAMLAYLKTPDGRGNVLDRWPSDRKLCLFAVACYRSIVPHRPEHERQALRWEEGDGDPTGHLRHWIERNEGRWSLWAALLRDIVGNPFRDLRCPTCRWDVLANRQCRCDDCDFGRWLAWNDGTVPKLARRIYDDRDFDLMPVLADALEDAGCTDEALLGHCRGTGPHVCGCWCLDLLLGQH